MPDKPSPESMRLLSQHYTVATVEDCKAHRCAKHAGVEELLNARGPQASECSLCVVQGVVDTMVEETLAPIVAAYAAAEERLKVSGVHQHASVRVLMALLTALAQKLAEGDFEVLAQRVIAPGSNKVN